MTRLSVKAVVVGVLVDFVATGILAVVVAIVFPAVRAAIHTAAGNRPSGALLVTALLIGFPTLALGGFVAGKIARRAYLLHGALVGAFCVVMGFAMSVDGTPMWFTITVAVLDIPVAMWGALLAKSRESTQQYVAGA